MGRAQAFHWGVCTLTHTLSVLSATQWARKEGFNMGLRDLLERLLPKLQHPWRKYMRNKHVAWKIVPLLLLSAALVAITMCVRPSVKGVVVMHELTKRSILDAQMPGSYSTIEVSPLACRESAC